MRFLLASVLLSASFFCPADSVHLLDGTVYKNCRIIYTTESETVIEYSDPASPSIRRELSLKTTDIYKIQQSTEEEIEAEKLEKLLRRAPTAEKEAVVKTIGMTEDFLKRYPESIHGRKLLNLLPSAQAALKEIEIKEQAQESQKEGAEKERNGQTSAPVVTPEDQDRYRFDMDAQKIYKSMMEFVKQKKEVKALQMFSLLEKMQGASCFPKARVTAIKLIGILETRWQDQTSALTASREGMERKADRLSGAKKTKALQFIREQRGRERADYQKRRESARENGYRWFNPPDNNLVALENAWSFAQQERKRLAQQAKEKTSHAGKASALIHEFWNAIDGAELSEAQEALTTLKSMGNSVVPIEYTTPMSEKLVLLKRENSQRLALERADSARKAQEQKAEARKKASEESRKRALEEQKKRLESFRDSREKEAAEAQQQKQERLEKIRARALKQTGAASAASPASTPATAAESGFPEADRERAITSAH